MPTEVCLDGSQDPELVVDDQHACAGRLAHARAFPPAPPAPPASPLVMSAGALLTANVKVNRAPPPARLTAQTRPPCASTRPLTIARPRPSPCGRGRPLLAR